MRVLAPSMGWFTRVRAPPRGPFPCRPTPVRHGALLSAPDAMRPDAFDRSSPEFCVIAQGRVPRIDHAAWRFSGFMSRYLRSLQMVVVWRATAVMRRSALERSGKAPTARMRRLISPCRRSRPLVERMRRQWLWETPKTRSRQQSRRRGRPSLPAVACRGPAGATILRTRPVQSLLLFLQRRDLPGFFGPIKARERCLQTGLSCPLFLDQSSRLMNSLSLSS